MKINTISLIFLLAIVSSCSSESNKRELFFQKNSHELHIITNYISEKIRREPSLKSNVVLVFVLRKQYSPHNNYIYDDYLAQKFRDLNIKQLVCESFNVKKCGYFEEMRFQMESYEEIPNKAVFYIYNRCDAHNSYQKKYLFQKKLMKNWVLLIDET